MVKIQVSFLEHSLNFLTQGETETLWLVFLRAGNSGGGGEPVDSELKVRVGGSKIWL